MKKVFTSLSVLLFILCAHFSEAATINYYVLNGNSFKLTPTGGTGFAKLFWKIDDNSSNIIEMLGATGGVLTHSFTDAATEIKVHKISLSVLSTLDACLSTVVDYNIIVLPKIELTITTPDKINFCTGTAVDANLTAKLSVTIGTNTAGVTLSPFTWKQGSTILSAETNVLHVVEAGIYSVLCSYKLPTDGTWAPTGFLLDDAITGASQTINNNLTIPVVPEITLSN